MRAQLVEALLAEIGARQWGIVRHADAAACGITLGELNHHVKDGRLIRVGRGIYRLRDHPLLWETRVQAALFGAGEGAVVSHRTAARLHECWQYRDCDVIEVTRLRGSEHRSILGRVHETRLLPEDHVTTVRGFPCTTIARTAFDLAGDPDPEYQRSRAGDLIHARRMEHVFNDAIARRGLSVLHEVAVLATLAKRGRGGTRLVRDILRRFGPRYVPTYSQTETLFTQFVDTYGLPQPIRQVPISDEEGWIGTFDFVFNDELIAEVDSSWHDGPLEIEQDELRDKRLRAAGYDVRRVRYGEIALEPTALARDLRTRLHL